jgi:hypothetical protein
LLSIATCTAYSPDFSCDLPLLLREMRYFRSHIGGVDANDADEVWLYGGGVHYIVGERPLLCLNVLALLLSHWNVSI